MKQPMCLACAAVLAAGLAVPAGAAQVDDSVHCFGTTQAAEQESVLTGVCITRLPEPEQGTVMLGSRILRPGDVLTAQQMEGITFVSPVDAEDDAVLRYLPVFSDGLSDEVSMTLSVRNRENRAPIAEDSTFETYKNLEVTGRLRVRDPEGEQMQFTVTRQPRRGTIEIREDGGFTYTPKKNKVGVDSFTYTAADPAGKVSRETTVTVTILKPSDARQYSDTAGLSCRFAAEWMKNTGIFVGEQLDGNPCFSPDRSVNRGEFLAMLVKTLKLPTEETLILNDYPDAPVWLRPYLAAAVRSGLIAALPDQQTLGLDEPITATDAARLLCSALNLTAGQQAAISSQDAETADALAIAREYGFCADGDMLTRADTASLLYRADQYLRGVLTDPMA